MAILLGAKITESIVKLIPHPPFPIEIIVDNDNLVYTGNDFKNRDVNKLKDYRWKPDPNVAEFAFDVPLNESGIVGKGLVGLIIENDLFTEKIELSSRTINVDGEEYELERNIVYRENEIRSTSQSIEVNEDGSTKLNDSDTSLAFSKIELSLHGIEIPYNLFPNSWEKSQMVQIKWPFPVLLIIDIIGGNDLNLNSARTEILFDEKWIEFETKLALLVLSAIKSKMQSVNDWNILKDIFLKKSKSELFNSALSKMPE